MTRIHGAGSYPTPPALDSAAAVAATSRPARASRSKGDAPLATPGAPDAPASRSSGHAGSRPRIASARAFAERGAPDGVSERTESAAGAQDDAGVARFVTVSRLRRPGHDGLDPTFTYRLRGSPSSMQALLFKLAAHPRMEAGTNAAGLTRKAGALRNLVATAGVMGMPVVLYCDVDAGQSVHPGRVEALFALPETRDTTILWAHCGGVGRVVRKAADHADYLRSILEDAAMRHIHIDLSWPRMARQIMPRAGADGKPVPDEAALRAWARLIDDHPDRFLFGSESLEACARAAAWKAIGTLYRPLLATLTPQARRAITTDNYARLVLDARPRMRAFAQHVLTPAFVEQDLRAWEDGCSNYGARFDPAVLRTVRDAAYAGAGVDVDGRRLA
jgi:hypothetical protein